MALLEGNAVVFSDKVKKTNQNEWTQDRVLVITKHKIFNIHKAKSKRDMDISKLSGISRSMLGKKPEFTLHFKTEYDYRFVTEK